MEGFILGHGLRPSPASQDSQSSSNLLLTAYFTSRFPMLIDEYRYTHRNINLGESSYSPESQARLCTTHCDV
jgi:hypothetical protein